MATDQNPASVEVVQRKPHVCEYAGCSASFFRADRLADHVRTHTGERPYSCQHPGCQKSYKKRTHLTRHQATSHPPPGESAQYQCPVETCRKQLTTLDNYRRHQQSHQRRQFTCTHCPRAFIKRQHLRIHEYQHTGVRPFHCDREGCDKTFVLPSKLREHQQRHDKYRCTSEGCGSVLANWSQLVRHRRQEHLSQRTFSCPTCNAAFQQKSRLRVHQQVHGVSRFMFNCPHEGCTKSYTSMSNLRQHIRCVHEGRRFVCSVETCQLPLVTKAKLKQHMTVVHGTEPKPRKPPATGEARRRRKDRGLPRLSNVPAITQLTDQPLPDDQAASVSPTAPQSELSPDQVRRLTERTLQLKYQLSATSRLQAQAPIIALQPGTSKSGQPASFVEQVLSSETESFSDDSSARL